MHVKSWTVEIADEFEPEFDALDEDVQTEILALSRLLQQFGPQPGRHRVDTLNGSRHANMKELRFSAADGEWRLVLRHLLLFVFPVSKIVITYENSGQWLVASG